MNLCDHRNKKFLHHTIYPAFSEEIFFSESEGFFTLSSENKNSKCVRSCFKNELKSQFYKNEASNIVLRGNLVCNRNRAAEVFSSQVQILVNFFVMRGMQSINDT